MNHILTALNSNYIYLLFDFLISLKELGKFNGKVTIFYHDKLTKVISDIFAQFNVDWIVCTNEITVNSIYIDAFEYIEKLNGEIAILDVDMWFQENVNNLFSFDDRLMFVPDAILNKNNFQELSYYMDKYINKYSIFTDMSPLVKMKSDIGFHLNGGLVVGSKYDIHCLLKYMNEQYKLLPNQSGIDQMLMNLYFDIKQDNYIRYEYNVCLNKRNESNIKIIDGIFYICDKKAIIIHTQKSKNIKQFLFKNVHPYIYKQYFNQLNSKQKDIINKFE